MISAYVQIKYANRHERRCVWLDDTEKNAKDGSSYHFVISLTSRRVLIWSNRAWEFSQVVSHVGYQNTENGSLKSCLRLPVLRHLRIGAVTVFSLVWNLTIIHGPIKEHFSFTLLSYLGVRKRKGFCSLCLLLKDMHLRDKPDHKLPKSLHTLMLFSRYSLVCMTYMTLTHTHIFVKRERWTGTFRNTVQGR